MTRTITCKSCDGVFRATSVGYRHSRRTAQEKRCAYQDAKATRITTR